MSPADAISGPDVIRLAGPADLPAVRELIRLAYARYQDRMDVLPAPVRNDYVTQTAAGQVWVLSTSTPAPASAPVPAPAPEPDAAAASTTAASTTAASTAAIVGVVVLIENGDALLIENVAVSPAAQGTGLGRRLMEFAETQARARGLRRLTLYTHVAMTENQAIYAHLGYEETGRARQGDFYRVFMAKGLD